MIGARGARVTRTSSWLNSLFAAILVVFIASIPRAAAAQSGVLQVIIVRPGEGETLYAGPDSPRTAIRVLGRVFGSDFEPSEIEIHLVVLQDGAPVSRASGTPDADGAYSFWVSINPLGPEEVGRTSGNCWPCHGASPVTLPPGPSVIRVTAVEPTGRTAVAERKVKLDRSTMARLDVRVTVAGQPGQAVRGLPVTASTRIYDWRNRQFSANTSALGRAALDLEALTQAPTRYRIGLPPIVVDGTLYQSSQDVEITLPAGATMAAPVELVVEAQLGRIDGIVRLNGQPVATPLRVHAVDLSSGRASTTETTGSGFAFAGLPIGRYLVGPDPDQAAVGASGAALAEVDLAAVPHATCTLDLDLVGAPPESLRGTVRDPAGRPAPFVWLESDDGKTASPAGPISGVFAWSGLPAPGRVLRVSAPGFWSRVVPALGEAKVDVVLRPRPDTRTLAWGSGLVILPAASLAEVSEEKITLRRGWVWGRGEGPLTVDTPDATLRIAGGRFAVEYIPGETAWLYVMEGEAQIGAATVRAGEMVAFAGRDIVVSQPVALDEAAVRILQQERSSPILFEPVGRTWDRLEVMLAHAGINAPEPVQAAGGAGVVALLALGAVYAVRTRRRKRSS